MSQSFFIFVYKENSKSYMITSNQPNVNNPFVRMKMLTHKMDKIQQKLNDIAAEKKLMELGVPSMIYESYDEMAVDVEFQIRELNSLLLEVRFIGWNNKYDMPYSLN